MEKRRKNGNGMRESLCEEKDVSLYLSGSWICSFSSFWCFFFFLQIGIYWGSWYATFSLNAYVCICTRRSSRDLQLIATVRSYHWSPLPKVLTNWFQSSDSCCPPHIVTWPHFGPSATSLQLQPFAISHAHLTAIYNIFAEDQCLFPVFSKNIPQQTMGLLNSLGFA